MACRTIEVIPEIVDNDGDYDAFASEAEVDRLEEKWAVPNLPPPPGLLFHALADSCVDSPGSFVWNDSPKSYATRHATATSK